MEHLRRNRAALILAAIVVLGVGAGVAIGLVVGWVVVPVRYTDTSIADLAPQYKDDYMVLVASGYAVDGNIERAESRLKELDVPNVGQSLSSMIDRWIAEGHDQAEIRALAALAHDMGMSSPRMLAYIASPTPLPTDTPLPTPTPAPTDTPLPTDTPVPTEVPTDTPVPTDTAVPATDTPTPEPTSTPAPPTNTPKPKPTQPPAPTATPKPTQPPQPKWTWDTRLVGPGEDGQGCGYGNLQIRVTVVNAANNQLNGIWVHDQFSGQYQVTGNVDSPDWGPGETKFEYGQQGGGSLCIAEGQGGACTTAWTRGMPCFDPPPFEDMWAAGYCNCCWQGISKEECQGLYNSGAACVNWGHYSWRVVYRRNW